MAHWPATDAEPDLSSGERRLLPNPAPSPCKNGAVASEEGSCAVAFRRRENGTGASSRALAATGGRPAGPYRIGAGRGERRLSLSPRTQLATWSAPQTTGSEGARNGAGGPITGIRFRSGPSAKSYACRRRGPQVTARTPTGTRRRMTLSPSRRTPAPG